MRFYGADGIVPFAWLADPFYARPSLLALTSDERWTWAFYVIALAAVVAFTVGYQTRRVTVLFFLVLLSMINRTPTIMHGEDLVSRQILFFACFASLGDRWSVDAWLRSRRGLAPVHARAIWPLRLMQLALVFVYMFSMPAKPSDDVAWRDGTAIYYVMSSWNWARFPQLAPLFYSGPLSYFMSLGTLVVEGAFPLLVWWKRTRAFALISIFLLQVGIALLVNNVLNFNAVMLTGFLLFVPDTTFARVADRLMRRTNVQELPGRRLKVV
ncbi:MAG: HTTM domain-containing protein, partial [Chloroflexi bacterium]|nr:HTTM domain-containing protein [Chloroflexota bacterium]